MRRGLASLLVVLVLIALAEHRLSDGQPRWVGEPLPELWDHVHHSVSLTRAAPAATCVLVVSLDRDSPYTLTSADEGVRFDIDADGDLEQVAWTPPGSDVAFLAIDRDGDGKITSARELITRHSAGGAGSAPDALIALASDASGGSFRAVIDTAHPVCPRFVLWKDKNHNGISEDGELRPVPQSLSGIGLGFSRHHRRDRHGNESQYRGFVYVISERGTDRPRTAEEDRQRTRAMYDACLVTR